MKSATLSPLLFLAATTACASLNHRGVEAFLSPPVRTISLQQRQQTINPTPKHSRIFQPCNSLQTHHYATPSNSNADPLVLRASQKLTFATWLSWWSQLILTVISSVTFLFARNVLQSQTTSSLEFGKVASKFVLPGVGIVTSIMSIIWTWGGRRLAKRLVKRNIRQVEAANLLRRVITVGCTLNLIGLLTSLLGAQYIVGTLVAKAMQNVVGFGSTMGSITSQVLQPLDVLVVQANTNVLTSHFVSLGCLLWLTRMVDLLDPPSLEEDSS